VLDNHLSIGTFFKGCVIFLLNFSEFSRGPDIDPSPHWKFVTIKFKRLMLMKFKVVQLQSEPADISFLYCNLAEAIVSGLSASRQI
jgi:hypothetical protein